MAKVYLSPSPAHFNVGYGNYGTEEQRMNIVGDVVEYQLTRCGVTVVRNDPDMSLPDVVAQANAGDADIYVALQSQAANTQKRGAQVYYYRPGGNGERLADDIFTALSAVTPTEDIGTSDGSRVYGGLGYYELRRTRMPAVIVMVGFHDNPLDADFIIENAYEIGTAISQGILEYFGISCEPEEEGTVQRMRAQFNGVTF